MSSGHTGKGGRGNRRARRGAQRPRGPEGQNGQPSSSSAMLILSSSGRQTPAHPERERPSAGDDATSKEGLQGAEDALSMPGDAPGSADGQAGAAAPLVEMRPEQQRPAFAPPAPGRGPHERSQPYAPGMRPHTPATSPTKPPRPTPEGSEWPAPSAHSLGEQPTTERDTADTTVWQERDMLPPREITAIPTRWARAEHDERGDHSPLRPEVRGEVGPLIDALRGLFEQDRATASQGGSTRCGICYLHYALAELEYREEEGFYVCRGCARSLGNARLPMVRRQKRA